MPVNVPGLARCAPALLALAVAAGAPAAGSEPEPSGPVAPEPPPAVVDPAAEEGFARARKLSRDGQYDRAAEEYAKLWASKPLNKPALAGMHWTSMCYDMELVASRSPDAKARFVALRDATEKRLTDPAAPDYAAADDFFILNKVVGDVDRALVWFDKAKANAASVPEIQRSFARLEELLEAKGRWADLGTYVYLRPKELAEQIAESNRVARLAAGRADPGERDMLNATQDRTFCARTSRLYAALLAAKRDADADDVIVVIAPGDTGGRAVLACITRALEIGEAREVMRKHLDAAWKKGAGIRVARDGLNRALKAK